MSTTDNFFKPTINPKKLMSKIVKEQINKTAPFLKSSVLLATPYIILFIFVLFVFYETIYFSLRKSNSEINILSSGSLLPLNKHSCFLRNTANLSSSVTMYVPLPKPNKLEFMSFSHCGSVALRSFFGVNLQIRSENNASQKFQLTLQNTGGQVVDSFFCEMNYSILMTTFYNEQLNLWVWKTVYYNQDLKTID